MNGVLKWRSRELTVPNPDIILFSSLSVDFDNSSLSKLNPRGLFPEVLDESSLRCLDWSGMWFEDSGTELLWFECNVVFSKGNRTVFDGLKRFKL